jgi:hypothetical protein
MHRPRESFGAVVLNSQPDIINADMQSTEIRRDQPHLVVTPDQDLRSDPRWILVERILHSAPFQKSTNLHSLFSYLAENTIRGKTEALTERQIGEAVFGKPAGYSPAEDSAVRVHMRQLRLRLHEYFDQEGRHEVQRLGIPKGSYLLEFQSSEPEVRLPSPPVAVAVSKKTWRFALREVLFWTAIAAAIVCAFGWYRAARTAAPVPVPWPLNAVIEQDQQTRIVVSDSSTMLRQLGNQEITLDKYLRPGFRESMIPPHLEAGFSRLVNYISDSQLTSFADLMVYSNLKKLAGPLDTQITLTSARDLDRRDLERGNYVFVGGPTSNPWVLLFANQLNFQEMEDGIGGKMYFLNKKPLPGEQNVYQGLAETGAGGQDYATISLLPGSMGQGNVLILQGLRQEGTEALGELLADPDDRAQLERALANHGDSQHSPYFEALIRTQAVAGAPVSIQIVTVRSIHR